jgi:formiminotetrahydrofolate cyclodeaminase
MSRLTDKPFRDLLAEFASSAPTPGGGSASALAAAVGLSLLAMVARMPRTRSGSDEERATLDRALTGFEHLTSHAVDLVDDDAAAYEGVVAAYRIPRTTEEEKTARRAAIEAALRGAAEVPLEVMRTARAGLTDAREVARCGNAAASSDVGVAVELLAAALRGAALNVKTNLDSMREAGYVDGVRAETARLETSAVELAQEVRAALGSISSAS